MHKINIVSMMVLILVLLSAGCATAQTIDVSYDPADLKFSG